MRAYSTARRISSWFWTHFPSSVIATTPLCTMEAMGANSRPSRFLEIAPVGRTFTLAVSRARSLIQVMVLGLSATGEVLGIQTTVVNPPAAADRAPDAIVSL